MCPEFRVRAFLREIGGWPCGVSFGLALVEAIRSGILRFARQTGSSSVARGSSVASTVNTDSPA